MQKTVLIIDDKHSVYESLALNFQDFGYRSLWAADSRTAMETLSREEVSVVLLDLSLGHESGIDLLPRIKAFAPALPVIMITGYGTLELAVKSIKIGAYDFLSKPLDFDRLRETVEQALSLSEAASDTDSAASPPIPGMDGIFPSRLQSVRNLYRRAALLARTDLPVLVTGESGTGKEHLVELIHAHSRRGDKPMERINCSAFPETLIDNELFGHEKGAFTGAQDSYSGLFERADGGTLHLDEVGDLALSNQAKLLRVLEDGMVRRLGGSKSVAVDVRVIASTNKDLPALIQSGQFRQDLFYRLNAAYLYLPPLRERMGDLHGLVDHFLAHYPGEDGKRREFTPEALALLAAYGWPGNIRELKNVIRTGVAVSSSPRIGPQDLPPNLEPAAAPDDEDPDTRQLENVERDHIKRALEENRYNKKKTSQQLGIDRKTLYNKMKNYGIS